jgi:hypothetical protein
VLRAADRGEGVVTRSLRRAIRLAAGVALNGLVSPVGPSELDIVDSVTGEVVGTWFEPPSTESAPAWLPELQHELDQTGLDAFRQKYFVSLAAPIDRLSTRLSRAASPTPMSTNATSTAAGSSSRRSSDTEVAVTNELAHHFGMDDDRLDELGWS